MKDSGYQKMQGALKIIKDKYPNRSATQQEIADEINKKEHTHVTTRNVAEITRQAGYHHTVKRDDKVHPVIIISKNFMKNLTGDISGKGKDE